MSNIEIISSNYELTVYLNKNRLKKGIYLDISNYKFLNKKFFDNSNFLPVKESKNFKEDKDSLIKDYINLISKLSISNHSKVWWCSEHTSKNRFTSNLAEIILSYIKCKRFINNHKNTNLIVIVNGANLKNYIKESIGQKKFLINKINKFFIRTKNNIFLIKNTLALLLRLLLAKIILAKYMAYNGDDKLFLIKSHFYLSSVDESQNYTDSFFDFFVNNLNKNIKIMYLVHVQENFLKSLIYIKNMNKKNIYPFEYFLSLKSIISTYLEIIYHKKFNFNDTYFQGENISKILEHEYLKKPISISHLSIFYSLKKLTLDQFFVRAYLTYENIAWESAFIKGVKLYSPLTRIIGHQHTVVPQASLGMFVGKDELDYKPLPHKILTTGIETKNIIEKYSYNYGYPIVDAYALRYPNLLKHIKIKKIKNKKIKNILIALEGIEETSKLIDIIGSQNESLLNYNITIRTHKVLPWKKIKKLTTVSASSIKHFIISEDKSLTDDLNNADVCLYWGSTVCIEALSLGIPLINYNNETILSYDPLFNCQSLKWEFKESDSLKKIIEKIDKIDSYILLEEKKTAMNYIYSYLSPPTKDKSRLFENA